jgi:hypothetical protein
MTTQTSFLSSTVTQDATMTYMTFQDFLTQFANPDACIDFILKSHDEGNVHTVEYTIPHYTYNAQANKFIAYGDHIPSTYYYEMRINIPATNDLYYVKFPRACYNSMTAFQTHLANRLSDAWGEYEREEVNITDPSELERAALGMQFALNIRRMGSMRRTIIQKGNDMGTQQFIQNCRDLANLEDETEAMKLRLEDLIYITAQNRR